jgi:hypothetical protein
MTGRAVRRLQDQAERWTEHRRWPVRRAAQLALLGLVLLRGSDRQASTSRQQQLRLAERIAASRRVQSYLYGRGPLQFWLGLMSRVLALRMSASVRKRQLAQSDQRTVVLRMNGRIDQVALSNLLIWQNHLLDPRSTADDGHQVDIMLRLMPAAAGEPRLFDLISVALMLERMRNLSVFWDDTSLETAVPMFMSDAERDRWTKTGQGHDLHRLSPEIIDQVEQDGTCGGVRLLPDGRKRVQDFFKAALPGQVIIAVGLREDDEGSADPDDLRLWLSLLDDAAAGRPNLAFVVLNRLAPSQWRIWPSQVRFARHQGLSMQDALCLVQAADGYAGVLDIFGLTANAAGRPGVYVPLMDGDRARPPLDRPAGAPAPAQIMVGSRDRAAVAAALERFLSALPQTNVGNYAAGKA